MQRCNDLLIAGIKTYGGLTSYLGNPDGGRSLLSELQGSKSCKDGRRVAVAIRCLHLSGLVCRIQPLFRLTRMKWVIIF